MAINMLTLGVLFIVTVCHVHSWDYFEGGDDWTGKCSTGNSQSPIDLKDSILTKIDDSDNILTISFDLIGTYTGSFAYYSDGGIRLSLDFGTIIMNDKNISITNMHYHAPSEHTVNGDYYDVELHLVGSDQDGTFYEIGIFLTAIETANKFVQATIDSIEEGKSKTFNTEWLVPNGVIDNYYVYNGSISAPFPDCYEGTGWLLLADPVEISESQLDYFNNKWKNNDTFAGGRGNNRKVQAANGRTVYYHSNSYGVFYGLSLALYAILA